ncbi:locomotion-related protein Hikaru genki [Bacillus rossius redtenbacheri]|uniref:locomotion-related protein Hikaru genki n=1 Tax=Bacillus rossius redtenbacheri TaxID=93214 RepID=UPI002FDCE32E
MWSPLVAMATLLCGLGAAYPARRDGHGREWTGTGCPPPDMALNGSMAPYSANERHLADYSQVSEVKFVGQVGPLEERRMCKIKCIGGEWVGPLCHKSGGGGHQRPARRCRLQRSPPHVILTYRNTTVQTDYPVFPHGAVVTARCRELGVYKLLGDSSVTCLNAAWSRRLPACIPTTLLTNFTEDSPPGILVRIPSGSASVEPSGVLAVYPGSILHLECLYSRKLGSPEWTWTSAFRQYLTGWAIAAEEREWKYRLSIYYSKPQDSGVYTCSSPRGLNNSIIVHVTAVHCEPLEPDDPRLTSRVEGTRLGQLATFQCPAGHRLRGAASITCQASGQWSGPTPSCTPIICPSLQLEDPHLSLVEHNTSYGGRAVFRCSWGYRLTGPPGLECELDGTWSGPIPSCEVAIHVFHCCWGYRLTGPPGLECELDGTWSGPIPSCEAVLCPPPPPPVNGRLLDEGGDYRVGAALQFSCLDRHQLVGEATIVCTETGLWSHPPPFCRPRCVYPGDPLHGRIAPVKFFYEPGDHLKVTCSAGYVERLEARPVCRGDGTWSEEVPECRSYRDV